MGNACLEQADLTSACLDGVYLDGASLEHACLSEASLKYAALLATNLTNALLAHADLTGVDRLTREQLLAANVDSRTVLPEEFTYDLQVQEHIARCDIEDELD